jgi:hypothetical protein
MTPELDGPVINTPLNKRRQVLAKFHTEDSTVADAFCDTRVTLVASRRLIDISGLRDALEGL